MNLLRTFFYSIAILLFPSFLLAQLTKVSYLPLESGVVIQPTPSLLVSAAMAFVRSIDFTPNLPLLRRACYDKIIIGFERVNNGRRLFRNNTGRGDIFIKYLNFINYVLNIIANDPQMSVIDKEENTLSWILKFKSTEIYKQSGYERNYYNDESNLYIFDKHYNFFKRVVKCDLLEICQKDFLEKSTLINRIFKNSLEKQSNPTSLIESIILKLPVYPLFIKRSLDKGNIWQLLTKEARQPYLKKIILKALYKKNSELTKNFIDYFKEEIFKESLMEYVVSDSNNDKCLIELADRAIEYTHNNFNDLHTSSILKILNNNSINIRIVYIIDYLLQRMQSVYSKEKIKLIANYDSKNYGSIWSYIDPSIVSRVPSLDKNVLEELLRKQDISLTKDEIIKQLRVVCGFKEK